VQNIKLVSLEETQHYRVLSRIMRVKNVVFLLSLGNSTPFKPLILLALFIQRLHRREKNNVSDTMLIGE
jgi:hypothetical protein